LYGDWNMSANVNDVQVFDGLSWNPTTAPFASGNFGDGVHGAIVETVNRTQTADIRATTYVVNPGVVVDQAGFETSATVSIVNNGTIRDDGAPAVAGSAGIARSAACTAGVAGGSGGGRGVNGDPMAVNPALTILTTPESVIGQGGAGAGAGAGMGGNNGSGFTVDTTIRSPLNGPNPTEVISLTPISSDLISGAVCGLTVGCGGGGGNAVTGGTGGAGGGIIRLRSPLVTNAGVISAKGGNGSAGTAAGGSGGGGGSGGRIIVVGKRTGAGTYSVAGGSGGAGNGIGTAGAAGQNGLTHFYG
jgi:hypothetical protein